MAVHMHALSPPAWPEREITGRQDAVTMFNRTVTQAAWSSVACDAENVVGFRLTACKPLFRVSLALQESITISFLGLAHPLRR